MPFESFDRQPDISSESSIQWGDLAGVYTMRPESNGRYTVDASNNQLSTSYYSETVSGGNGGVYFETIRGNGPFTSYSTGSWDNRDFYGSRYDIDPYMNRWDPRYSYIDPYMDRWDPRYSNIDQGIYDPRFTQDPRYAYDQRYYDPRYSQDPRYAYDQRYYDPRYSQDPRYAYDQRYYDPRYSQDPRYAYDQRYYDPRLNNRNIDFRYQWGGNRWDPRISGDYRYDQYQQQGRPYFDPRQRQLEQMYRPGGNVADFMVNQMQAQIQRRQQENYYRRQQENYYRQQQAYRQPYDYRQQQNDAYRQQQIEQYRRQQQYEAYVRSQQQQQQRYDSYRQDPRQQPYDASRRQQQTEAYRREQYENYMRQQQSQNGYRDDVYNNPRSQRYQPQQGDANWARLSSTVDGMVGRSTLEYNRNVPENLGCATFVSAALSRAYGLQIRDTGVAALESTIKKNNFQQVPLDQIRPGDVIIGHRAPGDYGHAAIYMGDGKIANNNSGKRQISIDSANKFNNPSFKQVRAYRYTGDVGYA